MGFDKDVDNEIVHELFNTTLKRLELFVEYTEGNELHKALESKLATAKEIHEGLPAKEQRLTVIRTELSENQESLSRLIALQNQINTVNKLKHKERKLEDELRNIKNHETIVDFPISTVESITTPFLDNEAEKLQAELRSVSDAIDEATGKITALHGEAINPDEIESLCQTIARRRADLEHAIQENKNQKTVLSDSMHNENIQFEHLTNY